MDDFYANLQKQQQNDVYIHLHQQNIGKLTNATDPIVGRYADLRKSAINSVKTDYATRFINSVSKNDIELLKELYSEDNELNESLMNDIQNQLSEALDSALPHEKIQSAMAIGQKASGMRTGNSLNFENLFSNDFKMRCQAYNDLIDTINQALRAIAPFGNSNIAALVALLKDAKGTEFSENLPDKLISALNSLQTQDGRKVNGKALEQIIKNLKTFANSYQKNLDLVGKNITNAKGQTYTYTTSNAASAIKKVFQGNVFSTGIGEYIIGQLDISADSAIKKFQTDYSGTSSYNVTYKDESGAENMTTISQGKTDVKLNNVQVALSLFSENNESATITIDIGISGKNYLGGSFDQSALGSGTFSGGLSGTLGQMIINTFGTNVDDRYFIYNHIVHNDEYYQQIMNLSTAHQINRLFATTGANTDFSQFMVLNGKVLPIWNIIVAIQKYLEENGSSVLSNDTPVSIAISNIKDIQQVTSTLLEQGQNLYNAVWARSHEKNAQIRSASIVAHLHLQKLKYVLNK